MDREFLSSKPRELLLFISGVFTSLFILGIIVTLYIAKDLSTSDQAQIFATVLGSVGTLLLALATFVNIFQTNRRLRMEEKEREKPLVIEELSRLIQPAIESLQNNLQQIENSTDTGCAFEWIYVDSATLYSGSRGPDSVQTPDSLPMARLAVDNNMLYGTLRAHDMYTERVAEEASRFHKELKPEIERLLEREGVKLEDQSLKVVSSAVLKEIDHFGESHDLYDFWENNREYLIRYANEELDTGLEEIKSAERVYYQFMDDALEELKARKAKLKHEYGISEDEITPEFDDDFGEII